MQEDKLYFIDKLKEVVKQKGLKYTKQREIIFQAILDAKNHLGAEDIHNLICKNHPKEKIGIATVYRALSFLEEVKLISSITLENDVKKYETNFKDHHDHLICVKCNKIVEFMSEKIESEQEKIAKNQGFELIDHAMYLYGICENCR
jgi:Fur family ferric uptake transcriptional regulator